MLHIGMNDNCQINCGKKVTVNSSLITFITFIFILRLHCLYLCWVCSLLVTNYMYIQQSSLVERWEVIGR